MLVSVGKRPKIFHSLGIECGNVTCMFARNRWLLDKLLSVKAPHSSSGLFNMEIHHCIVTTSGHYSITINYNYKNDLWQSLNFWELTVNI